MSQDPATDFCWFSFVTGDNANILGYIETSSLVRDMLPSLFSDTHIMHEGLSLYSDREDNAVGLVCSETQQDLYAI